MLAPAPAVAEQAEGADAEQGQRDGLGHGGRRAARHREGRQTLTAWRKAPTGRLLFGTLGYLTGYLISASIHSSADVVWIQGRCATRKPRVGPLSKFSL